MGGINGPKRRGGFWLSSCQAVGAVPASPGHGLWHLSHVPGHTASLGHRSENHITFLISALQASHAISAECFTSCLSETKPNKTSKLSS